MFEPIEHASGAEPPEGPGLLVQVGQAVPMRAWVVGGIAVFAAVYLFMSSVRSDVHAVKNVFS